MNRPLTPRQREILELSGRLADLFAERATEHDRENTFPLANYDDLRESGYLVLTVPEELGGRGATLGELVLAQERLAMGCGSTALAVNMHVSPIGQWSSIWRDTGDPRLEELLRGVAEGKVVWASLTAEAGVQNNFMDASTTATKVDGGFRVTGRKIFCTNSVVATHFSFTARYDDENGPRVGLFRGSKEWDGFTFVETWDTLGMRGTQSNDLVIEDAFVPEESLVHSLPVGHLDPTVLKAVFCWGMPTFGAVYLGIAAGAMEWVRRSVLERGREQDPLVQVSFAQMEVLLETARAVLYRHCQEVETGAFLSLGVQEGFARAGLAKVVATNNAVEIMRHVVDVAGGAAFMRRFPLERMWRDVQAGPIMPYNNHQALQLFGATALGVELAPEVTLEQAVPASTPD
ncbi:MAG TPA: acyl-CoA dehydrogenase family protein [Gaiellaceae bacterium]|nr:acyl-CoA dehydrogenase family protein [Gaiellaceae bacterium]